jgi:hypothetical protein
MMDPTMTLMQATQTLLPERRRANASSAQATRPATSVLLEASTWPVTYESIQASVHFNVIAIGGFLGWTICANTLRLYMSTRKYPPTRSLPLVLAFSGRFAQTECDRAGDHERVLLAALVVTAEAIVGTSLLRVSDQHRPIIASSRKEKGDRRLF